MTNVDPTESARRRCSTGSSTTCGPRSIDRGYRLIAGERADRRGRHRPPPDRPERAEELPPPQPRGLRGRHRRGGAYPGDAAQDRLPAAAAHPRQPLHPDRATRASRAAPRPISSPSSRASTRSRTRATRTFFDADRRPPGAAGHLPADHRERIRARSAGGALERRRGHRIDHPRRQAPRRARSAAVALPARGVPLAGGLPPRQARSSRSAGSATAISAPARTTPASG